MHVLRHEPLQQRNTLALKSLASAYVSVSCEEALVEALEWASVQGMPVMTLGLGSNVILAGDIDALVVHQAQCGIEVIEDNSANVVLKVAAAENWHVLVQWCLQQGYYGLENLAFIPGTVGAAPIQNIGAYGVEIAPFIRRVYAIDIEDRQQVSLSGSECEFGYRDSVFKRALRDKVIITFVELTLSKTPCLQLSYPALRNYLDTHTTAELTPQVVFDAVVEIRQSRLPDPTHMPNAGSFFKNPVVAPKQLVDIIKSSPDLPQYPQANGLVKLPAAWLIDQCGWKGKRVGGFGVHPQHALVLVNYGGDKGRDLLVLAEEVRRSVFDAYGINLEIEPRVYGVG